MGTTKDAIERGPVEAGFAQCKPSMYVDAYGLKGNVDEAAPVNE